MAFSFGYIVNRLQDYHPKSINCDPGVTFDSVRVFSPDSQSYSKRLLYIANQNDLAKVIALQRSGHDFIALCPGKMEDLSSEQLSFGHLVLVDPETEFEKFFYKLQTISVYEAHYKSMIQNIRHDSGSVQDLIELFAASFYGSVVLWDENLKPICISDPACSVDARQINDFVRKFESANQLLVSSLQPDKTESYDVCFPLHIPDAGSQTFSALFRHIVFRGSRILTVMLVTPLNVAQSTKYREELTFVLSSIEELYLARLEIRHFEDPTKEFLRGVVNGEWSSPAQALVKAQELGLKTDIRYLFCVIDIQTYSPMQALIFIDSLSQALPTVPMIQYEGLICMLRQMDTSRSSAQTSQDLFTARLKRYNTCCGTSRGMNSLSECGKAYHQAKSALHLGERDRNQLQNGSFLFYYKDYMRFDSLQRLEQEYGDLNSLLPHKIQLFLQDSQRDDSYLQLIDAYLANSMSTSATAEALNMHRNTVIYRLKRLNELYGIRFQDRESLNDVLMMSNIQEYRRRFC